ncbi:MAG TPA: hypothetical protein VGF76_01145 [Polyangiaceae bacterium]
MRLSAPFAFTGAVLWCLGCSSNSDDVTSDSREGTIVVSEVLNGASAVSYEISASWLPPVGESGCSLTTVGACTVVSCMADQTSAATPSSLDAGPLVFASSSGSTMTLTTTAPASYESQGTGGFFAPGDTVTVTGQGGADLPAFAPVSVVAPAETTLLAPACAAGFCPTADRTQDLALSWSSQGPGLLSINLGAAAQSTTASCIFDLSDGTDDVPAEVLAAFPSRDAITLTVQAINDQPFTLGGLPTAFLVAETIVAATSPPASQ